MNDRTRTRDHHSLTEEEFTALARGGGDPAAIEQLVASQRSKHLILLGRVADMAGQDDGLAIAGRELLAQVQRENKAAADEVIGYPSVGAWALHTVRGNEAIPGAQPSGLASIAAAAAVRAGLDVEIEVPVVDGAVRLASLGTATADGGTAIVATKQAQVRSGDLRVEMRSGAPGWQQLRQATVGSLDIMVDDLDLFRMPATDREPTGRLAPPRFEELLATLRAAWSVLSSAKAAEVSAIVRVIVPSQAPESGRFSASAPQTFGTVALSRQPDKYACAEALVHETQHLKLSALLALRTLTHPDDEQRYYAPWRTDPRPASGLLQGAYAHLGVSGFWREQRELAPDTDVRQRAQAEFARWRDGAALVVETLQGSGQLTPHGQAFAVEMAAVLDEWRREPVPEEARRIARREADRHRASWTAENR